MPTLSPKVTITAGNEKRPLNKQEQRHVDMLAAMISLDVKFDDLDEKFDAFVEASGKRDESMRALIVGEIRKLREEMAGK